MADEPSRLSKLSHREPSSTSPPDSILLLMAGVFFVKSMACSQFLPPFPESLIRSLWSLFPPMTMVCEQNRALWSPSGQHFPLYQHLIASSFISFRNSSIIFVPYSEFTSRRAASLYTCIDEQARFHKAHWLGCSRGIHGECL